MGPDDDGGFDGSWVEAAPFRAHLRQLIWVGALTTDEAATMTGLSVRGVRHLLHGRHGRAQRRISPVTARRLLRISVDDVGSLRWCLTPAQPARTAYRDLIAAGQTRGQIATDARVAITELDALSGVGHCSRLLALRLRALVRALPVTFGAEPEHTLDRAA